MGKKVVLNRSLVTEKKVVLNENCKCWITQQDIAPPVTDFINDMANCGTYYNPCEQNALNDLYKEITSHTGIRTDDMIFTGTTTKTLTLKFSDLSELSASFEDIQGITTINNQPPDPAGNITIDAVFVGADPAGTAQGIMDGHIAAANPHVSYQLRSEKGQANGFAPLGADNKLPAQYVPDLAVSDYLGAVPSQSAMLALTGQKGDWAVRTDLGTTWIITGNDTTQLSSWTQLSYPTAPVTSVAGKTGAVTLNANDVGAIANQITTWQIANFKIEGYAQIKNAGNTELISIADGGAGQAIIFTNDSYTTQSYIKYRYASNSFSIVSKGTIDFASIGKYTLMGGNVLIGTTTDNGVDKLQVAGSISANGAIKTGNLTSAPTIVNGGLYYNSSINKEQIGINGIWKNIATEDSAVVTGHTIYVDKDAPNSTDTRTGISKYSQSQPFKTIQMAFSAASLYDTIIINGGTYTENISITTDTQSISVIFNNGSVLNGDIIQNVPMGIGLYITLNNSSVINGKLGQPSNMNGILKISGDRTGSIVTGNKSIFSNLVNITGIAFVNTGTAEISGYGDLNISNCTRLVASYIHSSYGKGTVRNCDIIEVTTLYRLSLFNCLKVLNVQMSDGAEHHIQAENCGFEYTINPSWIMCYASHFKNCTFISPASFGIAQHNVNDVFRFEGCSFEFTAAVTTAITDNGMASGASLFALNCSANSTKIINAGAQKIEQNSFVNSAYKVRNFVPFAIF